MPSTGPCREQLLHQTLSSEGIHMRLDRFSHLQDMGSSYLSYLMTCFFVQPLALVRFRFNLSGDQWRLSHFAVETSWGTEPRRVRTPLGDYRICPVVGAYDRLSSQNLPDEVRNRFQVLAQVSVRAEPGFVCPPGHSPPVIESVPSKPCIDHEFCKPVYITHWE